MSIRVFLPASAALCLSCALAEAQTAEYLSNPAPSDGVIGGFLMSDGTVLYQGGNVSDWHKFTPDSSGSYQNGTWTSIASMPPGYAPYAFSGNVLPDGRLLVVGGEYLLNAAGNNLDFTLTTQCAIYDPVADTWTVFNGPNGWRAIGDSPGALMPNGQYLLGEKVATKMAFLDATTLKWTSVKQSGKSDIFAEEGWTLLPDGTALTADVTNAPNSERYFPGIALSTGGWVTAGSTVANLKFVWTGANAKPLAYTHNGMTYYYKPAGEIGPAMLRPDGTVFATGAINKGATAGHTAVWTPGPTSADPGTWAAGPDFQPKDDAGDEYAVLLPSGNVLVEANTNGSDKDHDTAALAARAAARLKIKAPATGQLLSDNPEAAAAFKCPPPLTKETYHLYEFDGVHLALEKVQLLSCGNSYSLLPLPSGETIIGGFALYIPAGKPQAAWAPAISASPSSISAGSTYTVSGTQFNGLSQAAAFGDEDSTPTNYPMVRITNKATHHVFYAKTHGWSTSGVATGSAPVSTQFDVPPGIDTGASTLEVVADGIASKSVAVTVQ